MLVALENPCKKRYGILIGQLKDSRRISSSAPLLCSFGGEN
jgi:hypothetical protein